MRTRGRPGSTEPAFGQVKVTTVHGNAAKALFSVNLSGPVIKPREQFSCRTEPKLSAVKRSGDLEQQPEPAECLPRASEAPVPPRLSARSYQSIPSGTLARPQK